MGESARGIFPGAGDDIVCTSSPFFCWGLNLLPNFEKKGGLDRTSVFRRGLLGKRSVAFIWVRGEQFLDKKKNLNLEYILTKKVHKQETS